MNIIFGLVVRWGTLRSLLPSCHPSAFSRPVGRMRKWKRCCDLREKYAKNVLQEFAQEGNELKAYAESILYQSKLKLNKLFLKRFS